MLGDGQIGRNRNSQQDEEGDDRPSELELRIAVDLLGELTIVLALPPTEAEDGIDQRAFDNDEDGEG